MSKKKTPPIEATSDQLPNQKDQVAKIAPKFVSIAKKVFDTGTYSELHITADGTCFTQINNAQMHAASLKQPEIVSIKREEIK
ncbi:MAG: hypothetical protein PHG67_06165 [Bacteroidales bacterium]|jgi:hypothetical protein|nr:hypothetical protein [Bacteroidales bacterium]HOI32015.1 hypothetical protein [Bacteroidales bacterium]